jgi:hypothetical protein
VNKLIECTPLLGGVRGGSIENLRASVHPFDKLRVTADWEFSLWPLCCIFFVFSVVNEGVRDKGLGLRDKQNKAFFVNSVLYSLCVLCG